MKMRLLRSSLGIVQVAHWGDVTFHFALFDNDGRLLKQDEWQAPVRDGLFYVLGLDGDESARLERMLADEWPELPVSG